MIANNTEPVFNQTSFFIYIKMIFYQNSTSSIEDPSKSCVHFQLVLELIV